MKTLLFLLLFLLATGPGSALPKQPGKDQSSPAEAASAEQKTNNPGKQPGKLLNESSHTNGKIQGSIRDYETKGKLTRQTAFVNGKMNVR